jgi:hypothetical protein
MLKDQWARRFRDGPIIKELVHKSCFVKSDAVKLPSTKNVTKKDNLE